ncbi:hypothetical protein ACIRPJ_33110 [Streptomyces asoensis]|uniref:hypothetical protein n=1 Tax=Streptomyces asoensis TaxID=249586 RepID=UPI001671A798|nr:hypothetical protein [Streptomyces asoensis]GGQ97223.1 hypothetical protein GCM10010496_72650 [Streptomyces asoensis]
MKLKPVSMEVFAEARGEAHYVLARVMGDLAPGEYVLRLGVDMEGQERPLSAALPLTVEGTGSLDDLVGADGKRFDNFALLLACGLAQRLSYGVMYLRSPASEPDGPDTVQAWRLAWGVLNGCTAAEAAELLGDGVQAVFVDAPGVHGGDDGEGEGIYPPEAYRIV